MDQRDYDVRPIRVKTVYDYDILKRVYYEQQRDQRMLLAALLFLLVLSSIFSPPQNFQSSAMFIIISIIVIYLFITKSGFYYPNKKYEQDLAARSGSISLNFYNDFFTARIGDEIKVKASHFYKRICNIVETEYAFYISINRNTVYMAAKSGIDDGDGDELRDLLSPFVPVENYKVSRY